MCGWGVEMRASEIMAISFTLSKEIFRDPTFERSGVSFHHNGRIRKYGERLMELLYRLLRTRLKAVKKVFVLKDSQYLTISKQCHSMAVRKHSINMIHGDKNNPDEKHSTKSA